MKTKSKKWQLLLKVCDYITVFCIFAIAAIYMVNGNEEQIKQAIISNAAEDKRNEMIKSVIVWDTEYSEEIENAILYNLNLLPEDILSSWLSKDSRIVVCPNIKGYLDEDSGELENAYDNFYTSAYNTIYSSSGDVFGSDIYILGSVYDIDNSLLHEIGHYVYVEFFGTATDYVLPNYETDSFRFAENECENFSYYAVDEEYFAEVFEYTILNGVTKEYTDTYAMQEIIEEFYICLE